MLKWVNSRKLYHLAGDRGPENCITLLVAGGGKGPRRAVVVPPTHTPPRPAGGLAPTRACCKGPMGDQLEGSKEKRRRFSREVKLESVRMVLERGRKQIDIARGLGINPEVLYRWTREQRLDPKQSFPGNVNLKERDRQVEQLQRELTRLQAELGLPPLPEKVVHTNIHAHPRQASQRTKSAPSPTAGSA